MNAGNPPDGARDRILSALRNRHVEPQPEPTLDGDWIRYADPLTQFCNSLELVGGRAIRVCSNELPARVNSVDVFQEAQRVANFVPEYGELAAIWDSQADPHEAENVDFCLAPGLFGVAENGAIWTPTDQIAPRSALFLCQHLGLVVPAADIVDNMHQAYERIEFGEGGFGVFISGPSKTADIEQSLVIGAHGPRSLVVFLTT